MLLTPRLFRLLDRPVARTALYAVTPVTFFARYALSVEGFTFPIQAFFGSWLLFYLLGLEWRDRIAPRLRDWGLGPRYALAALATFLVLQELEGFAWFALGSYDLATTQLKATSMLSSACACALITLAAGPVRRRLASCKPLVRLGDLSFGVYLCHMVVLPVFRVLFGMVGLSGFPPSLMLWLVVLIASAVLVSLCQRIFPKWVLAAIGFV